MKLKKLAKDSWTATYDLPRDESGNRRQKRWTFRGRKDDADKALRQFLADLDRGKNIPGVNAPANRETFAEFTRRWLAVRERRVEADTFDTYKARAEQHLIPIFGGLPLTAITSKMIDAAEVKWRKGKRLDRKHGPLSDRTIHHIWTLLAQILKAAQREGIIERNPCDQTEPPKKNKAKPKGLLLADAVKVFVGLRSTDLYAPVAVAVLTGLRRGEILGLTWADVNFDDESLSVVRAATEQRRRDANGKIVHYIGIKEPKTPGSVRPHPLIGLCAEVLREHRAAQEQLADELGWSVTPETFVFGDYQGAQISPDAFSSAFYYAIRKHELPVVSVKGLRTSFATAMYQYGVGSKDIADLLGHTTDRTTREHYLMEVPQNKINAAKRLDRAVRQHMGGSEPKRAKARRTAPTRM